MKEGTISKETVAQEKASKNTGWEAAEMLGLRFYLANKLLCYCFMDAGGTPGSEAKDYYFMSICINSPWPPSLTEWHDRSSVDACTQLTVLPETNTIKTVSPSNLVSDNKLMLCLVGDMISLLKTCLRTYNPSDSWHTQQEKRRDARAPWQTASPKSIHSLSHSLSHVM